MVLQAAYGFPQFCLPSREESGLKYCFGRCNLSRTPGLPSHEGSGLKFIMSNMDLRSSRLPSREGSGLK